MKKWSVSACVAGSKHLGTFTAESGEDAIQQALDDNGDVSLCHQCSRQCEDGEAISASAEAEDGTEAHWSDDSWEGQARAAGWTPPKKKRTKKST